MPDESVTLSVRCRRCGRPVTLAYVAGVVVHRISAMGDGFLVELEEAGIFRVRGARIERIANQTNFDVEESAERFQRDLTRLGVDAELRRAGITAGDLVRIGSTELEWEAQPWERT